MKKMIILGLVFIACACSPPAKLYESNAVEPSPSACVGYMMYPQMTLQKTAGGHFNFSLYLLKKGSYQALNFPDGKLSNLAYARAQGLISEETNTAGVKPAEAGLGYCTTGEIKGDPCLVELWASPSCWLPEETEAPGAAPDAPGD